MDWHIKSHTTVAQDLSSSPVGLNDHQANVLIEKYGRNVIEERGKKTVWHIIVSQFTDLMILILAVAAVISGLIGELTDSAVILAIIVLNALVGFIQEYRAGEALEALKKMAASEAFVIREGQGRKIPASELVPGDVVMLEAGNIIPADLRFFETKQLKVDESALTGESENVEKHTEVLPPGEYAHGDMKNMGFKNTIVTHGRGSAYVVATGMKTAIGGIAAMIGSGDVDSPLRRRLDTFSKRLSLVILIICLVFFVTGLLRGQSPVYMLLVSVSLAVAAIPEALPALVTMALAFGARRLAKNKALVRNLPAVETLGSVTYICSDKTGTLTLNRMSVRGLYRVEPKVSYFDDKDLLLVAMALNSDVMRGKDGELTGDSTELALVTYAQEHGYIKADLDRNWPRMAEAPFDPGRRRMSTFHKLGDKYILIVKGAVDALLPLLADTGEKTLESITLESEKAAAAGQRVLGYAYRILETVPAPDRMQDIESSLTFTGFAGLIDPPREEARQAVAECKQAGIIPVMITGDHQLTAAAIARELGIMESGDEIVLDGSALSALSESEFAEKVEDIRVYARVSPGQKMMIVSALREKGHFVAMTGDGVNDAPALKNADIGVAMGITGTDVARESSDMILLDDNFATIVKAVAHGRRIFDNIIKFIKYILAGNTGELWAILVAPFFGLPIPLIPIQILWVNLVSDGLPGLALASEPEEEDVMKRPPFDPSRNLFSGGTGWHILWVGCLIGMLTIGMQAWAIAGGIETWQTMTFTVLCFAQMAHVSSIRTRRPFYRPGILKNKPMIFALVLTFLLQLMIIYIPFFNTVFHTQPLSPEQLLITLAVSSIIFFAVESEKLWARRRSRRV